MQGDSSLLLGAGEHQRVSVHNRPDPGQKPYDWEKGPTCFQALVGGTTEDSPQAMAGHGAANA
jgi:hypothetical protein